MALALPYRDEVPARLVVLGLVMERPNQTAAWYANAVTQRFPRAGFRKPMAYNALRRMSQGRTPCVRCTFQAGEVDGSKDRYEVTAEGRRVFDSWMFSPPTAIPAVRQALYGRIGLARLEDLPRLIRVVRQEEAVATHLYEQANEELRQHRSRARSRGSGEKTQTDFEREIHETWLYVGPLHWASRGALCLAVLDRFEDIASEAGVSVDAGARADAEHRPRRAG